jgi:N-succinyldiaminopimelate aminotransferase
MNPDLNRLQPYPFERLAELKAGINPPNINHIALSIGEPKHPSPDFVLQILNQSIDKVGQYPLTKGTPELRQAMASWLQQRFKLADDSIDIDKNILPVNGTREALFAFAQAVIDRRHKPLVLMPNPFYQIYEGAALLAGAEPRFYNATQANNYLADFDAIAEANWRACQLLFICTPGNPTGAVIPLQQLQALIEKAEKYDFIIAADECYAEIHFDENNPPPGLLQAAHAMGNTDFKRCVVFHSLSKRSNLPGLRSGFIAGDASIMQAFLTYRTYHGCAMSGHHQLASISAWNDEQHVLDNRAIYKQKFAAVLEILAPVLDVQQPDAGFYLWARTPIDDTDFAQQLFASQNITVLPGRYLSRSADGINPGEGHVRMALVASVDEAVDAANRIYEFITSL